MKKIYIIKNEKYDGVKILWRVEKSIEFFSRRLVSVVYFD